MSIDPAMPVPAEGLYQGRQACITLLRQALQALAPPAESAPPSLSGVHHVWWLDAQFADWPLSDELVLSSLTAWLRQGGRQLHLVGEDFEATARSHPRFARWRRDWAHVIEVLRPVDTGVPPGLRGLVAAPLVLQWLDAPDWRMLAFTDSVRARAASAQIADFLQRCEPSWPVTTLGL
jgi:hypothetical protein